MNKRSRRNNENEALEACEDFQEQEQQTTQTTQDRESKENKFMFLCTRPLKLEEFQQNHLNFYVNMIQVLLDSSLLKIALFNETRYSVECVTKFYKHLEEDDDGNLITRFKTKQVVISKSGWGEFFGVPYDGEAFDNFNKAKAWKELSCVDYKNKRESNSMGFIINPVLRLFLIAGRNVVCKLQGSMSKWIEEEPWLVWNCFNGRKVDVVDLMFNQMLLKKDKPPFPYANFITNYCVEHQCWSSSDPNFNGLIGKVIDMQSLAQMGFSEFKIQQQKPLKSRSEGSSSQAAQPEESLNMEAKLQSLTLEVEKMAAKQRDQDAEISGLKEFYGNQLHMLASRMTAMEVKNQTSPSTSSVGSQGFQAFSAQTIMFLAVGNSSAVGSEEIYHPTSPDQPSKPANDDLTFSNLDFLDEHTLSFQSIMED